MKTMIMTTLIMANQYSDSPREHRTSQYVHIPARENPERPTINSDVDELHGKNRCNDHEGILPCGDVWVPVL